MTMRRLKGSVLATLLLAVGACTPTVEQPEIWLEGVRIASLGLTGGVVEVQMSVHNPNRFAVQARGLTYDFQIRDPEGDRWIPFTDGRLDGDLRVAPRDTAQVSVPVEFSYRGLGEAWRGLLDRGSFDYRVSGVVELQSPVRRDIRYRHAGRYAPTSAN
jgi:LEA14-like dessication related protein